MGKVLVESNKKTVLLLMLRVHNLRLSNEINCTDDFFLFFSHLCGAEEQCR